jgi:hypothetical protein
MKLKENVRLARPFFVLLAIFATGRWMIGLNVPYERGTAVFSVVTLTVLSGIYYAAFTRRWRGYRIGEAVVLSMTLALTTQIVVLLSTLLSFAVGLETYWNHPLAVLGSEADLSQKVTLGQALAARALGLVANTFVSGPIAGALGWAMGGLLPER